MKSISHLFPSKEIEAAAWLNIIHHFSFDDTMTVIVFPYEQKTISILYDSSESISVEPLDKEIITFIFKNIMNNIPDINVSTGAIYGEEYILFKQNKLKYKFKFSDGIVITREDIPNAYKLLQ